VRITIVHADGAVNPVLIRLGSPPSSDQPPQINPEAPIPRVNAIDIGGEQISVMAGNHLIRNRGRQGFEDGVNDRHRVGHPNPIRSGMLGGPSLIG